MVAGAASTATPSASEVASLRRLCSSSSRPHPAGRGQQSKAVAAGRGHFSRRTAKKRTHAETLRHVDKSMIKNTTQGIFADSSMLDS